MGISPAWSPVSFRVEDRRCLSSWCELHVELLALCTSFQEKLCHFSQAADSPIIRDDLAPKATVGDVSSDLFSNPKVLTFLFYFLCVRLPLSWNKIIFVGKGIHLFTHSLIYFIFSTNVYWLCARQNTRIYQYNVKRKTWFLVSGLYPRGRNRIPSSNVKEIILHWRECCERKKLGAEVGKTERIYLVREPKEYSSGKN